MVFQPAFEHLGFTSHNSGSHPRSGADSMSAPLPVPASTLCACQGLVQPARCCVTQSFTTPRPNSGAWPPPRPSSREGGSKTSKTCSGAAPEVSEGTLARFMLLLPSCALTRVAPRVGCAVARPPAPRSRASSVARRAAPATTWPHSRAAGLVRTRQGVPECEHHRIAARHCVDLFKLDPQRQQESRKSACKHPFLLSPASARLLHIDKSN